MKNVRPWAIASIAVVLLVAVYLIWSADGPNPEPGPGPDGPPDPGGEVGDPGAPSDSGSMTTGQKAPPQPKEELVKVLEKTDKGFFFFHGFYVAPPYTVTLHTYAVRVNGIKVSGRYWTAPEDFIPVPTRDLPPFEWTPERIKNGFYDSGFEEHADQRFRFWKKKYGYQVACQMVLDYYRKQLLITKIVMEEEPGLFCFVYYTKAGRSVCIDFGRAKQLDPKVVWERDTKRLEEEADYFRGVLAGDCTAFCGRGMPLGVLSARRTKQVLPRMHAILIASETRVEEKVRRIEAERLIGDPSTLKALAEAYDYNDTPGLRKRLKELHGGIIKPAVFPKKEGVRK